MQAKKKNQGATVHTGQEAPNIGEQGLKKAAELLPNSILVLWWNVQFFLLSTISRYALGLSSMVVDGTVTWSMNCEIAFYVVGKEAGLVLSSHGIPAALGLYGVSEERWFLSENVSLR